MTADEKRLHKLRETITLHAKKYHEEQNPEISDEVYDALLVELKQLELEVEGKLSSGVADGARASNAFTKVKHTVKQWSFDNIFSTQELADWDVKVHKLLREADHISSNVQFVAEHKIDGLKLVIEYEAGKLVRCSTRGNGEIGEDVTHTAVTIASLPAILPEPVDLICVGEVWLGVKDFNKLNVEREKNGEPLFANPRNAAAGGLRQLDPAVAAKRNLALTVYDIDLLDVHGTTVQPPTTQFEELQLLTELGLPTSKHAVLCKSIEAVQVFYDKVVLARDSFAFAIDGVVLKVNDLAQQRVLGYTAKGPRFGMAYKLPSEQTTTVVEGITLQVGRTGKVTPVAELRPVAIAGSTVARATLHNEDFIAELDVRIGDTVIVQKAGDIIPEVLGVVQSLRPENTIKYAFPKTVIGCGGDGSIERIPGEAAYRCVSLDSDELRRQRLYYFVSKTALNIDGVGPRIIDQLLDAGLISSAIDLFTLTADQLELLESFQVTAARNVVSAIAQASEVELYRLLIGLSIDGVGEETARLLADTFGNLTALESAGEAEIAEIYGIGDTVAQSVCAWFALPANQMFIEALTQHLTVVAPTVQSTATKLAGQSFVLTGTLETFTRDEAKDLIRRAGGKIISSVSKKTDYVLVGRDPGTKSNVASELGVKMLNESEFQTLLGI
jgi:DNA ligase (NAD+)